MSEYIKRQDAIDELMEMVKDNSGDQFGGVLLHYTGIKAMLECVEPADVKPVVRGQWFFRDCGDAVCSICKVFQRGIWDYGCYQNFCGNCGADMRGGDAE